MRAVFGVENAVDTLVVRVARVDTDATQRGGGSKGTHQLTLLNSRAQVDRGQVHHVDEGVGVDRRQRAGQRQSGHSRVGKGAASELDKLGGCVRVILEGDGLKAAAIEGLVADAADTRGDVNRPDGGLGEGAIPDRCDALGDAHVRIGPPIGDQFATLVHDEVARSVGQDLNGDRRRLTLTSRGRDASGEGAGSRAPGGVEDGCRRAFVGGDGAQRGRAQRPLDVTAVQRGGQERVQEDGLPGDRDQGRGGQLDPAFLRDSANDDGHGRIEGRI